MTERLYYTSDATECLARVVNCLSEADGRYAIELDRTLFHPQGGGQPADGFQPPRRDRPRRFSTIFRIRFTPLMRTGGSGTRSSPLPSFRHYCCSVFSAAGSR